MKTFLFEQYGYYPKELVDNTFYIDSWMFKLINTNLTNDNLKDIETYITTLNRNFNNKGPFIIKNKSNSNLSTLNDTNYVLISSYLVNMSFQDLISFHYLFYKKEEYVELDKILEVWKNRVEEIENKLSTYLRVDSIYYKDNLDIAVFCIGLAINAMQYLSDIIYNYDKKLYGVTIVHKRLNNLNSFDLLNPFNFIVEHPLKDIALLYQSDYLSFDELKNIIYNYQIDVISATFFMARILYRVDVFDAIETKRDLEQRNQKLNFNIEKEMYKIKKAYGLLKEMFSIRPIDWLE
jgi:hypothetical protein